LALTDPDLDQRAAVIAQNSPEAREDRADRVEAVGAAVKASARIVVSHIRIETRDRVSLYIGRVGDNNIHRRGNRFRPIADRE
jgi:hypothetical protein